MASRGRPTTSTTRLSQLRVARGLTLDEIAGALGVRNRHVVWDWMAGNKRPTEANLRRLIELLATTEALHAYLFDGGKGRAR